MVYEGTYYFTININSHYYLSPKDNPNNTIVSLGEIIDGNVSVTCYDYNDVVPSYLISISHKDFSLLKPLRVPME